MNIALLKSKMALNGDTQITLARKLGITVPGLNNKFKGKSPFKHKEIEMITKMYKLSAKDIKSIFFDEV